VAGTTSLLLVSFEKVSEGEKAGNFYLVFHVNLGRIRDGIWPEQEFVRAKTTQGRRSDAWLESSLHDIPHMDLDS
jgi:hypothetical protein